jgi:hypothetical protein
MKRFFKRLLGVIVFVAMVVALVINDVVIALSIASVLRNGDPLLQWLTPIGLLLLFLLSFACDEFVVPFIADLWS